MRLLCQAMKEIEILMSQVGEKILGPITIHLEKILTKNKGQVQETALEIDPKIEDRMNTTQARAIMMSGLMYYQEEVLHRTEGTEADPEREIIIDEIEEIADPNPDPEIEMCHLDPKKDSIEIAQIKLRMRTRNINEGVWDTSHQ